MGYAISCGHELTAEAAEEILQSGGNAFDAIVAAFAASWVVEPCMSGPGGGGFAVVKNADGIRAIDFFTQTPKHKQPSDKVDFRPVVVNFGGTTEEFHFGYGSIAVPGAIDGLYTLYNMGARIPMEELVQPAIRYASEGHGLVPFQYLDMQLLRDIIYSSSRGRELFFVDGHLREPGDTIKLPHLADFLDFISREGRDAFYKGEISKKVDHDCRELGGHLRRIDFETYSARISNGSRFSFDDLHIYAPGGLSVGSKILESILLHTSQSNKAGNVEQMMEGMLHTHSQKHLWFDPHWNVKQGGTSHINIIDADENAVSLSMSLGEGSGCFIKGTDIQLNNMLGEAALLPDGWHSWTPDCRLQSMMTPVLAIDENADAILAAGSGGASRIPFAIAQVFDRYMRETNDIELAVTAPRIHWNGETWQAEPGLDKPSYIADHQWNAWSDQSLYFGGVHVSECRRRTYHASGDDRRDGVSACVS